MPPPPKRYNINGEIWTVNRLVREKNIPISTARKRFHLWSVGKITDEKLLHSGKMETGGYFPPEGNEEWNSFQDVPRTENLEHIKVGSWEEKRGLADGV